MIVFRARATVAQLIGAVVEADCHIVNNGA